MSGINSFLKKYRETMEHHHGWQVELTCPECGNASLPVYSGWKPQSSMNFGDKPTIFADLTCAACGRNIEDAAGKKLVELFADARIPPENRKVFFLFALGALAAPVVLLIPAIVTGIALLYLLPVIALTFILPSILLLNYRIASIRNRCECGKPEFLFMGLLGRAYCYRCSCCGRLLKLRD